MNKVKISEIRIYPIKSGQPVSLDSVSINPMGLAGDREFAFVQNGERIGQKQIREILHIGSERVGEHKIRLTFPGKQAFDLDTRVTGFEESITLYSKSITILDMGNEVACWATDALGEQVRLARVKSGADWFLPLPEFSLVHGKEQNKFVDAAPILLTNESSLEELNSRMDAPIPMDRFRANIVVTGLDAYLEDELPHYDFPGIRLERVTVCERCIMTTIDQTTGDTTKDPLNTLARYRKRADGYAGGIMFGIYVTATDSGILSVGDEIG
jgi:uncharacterized protein YcbX